MSRIERAIAFGLVVVVIVGAAVLVFGPARGMREDIGAQRDLVAAQLGTVRAQLRLQHHQLHIAREQLDLAQRQLHVAEDTRSIARRTYRRSGVVERLTMQLLQVGRDTNQKVTETVPLIRTLVDVAHILKRLARETERHARNLDRKTGPTPPIVAR
jgi:hypothetical protein